MEKVFCVFAVWIMQIISIDASGEEVISLRVQIGQNISLSCDMSSGYEMAWHHQHSQRLTQLVSAKISSTSGRKLLVTHNRNPRRLRVNATEGIATVTLLIAGVTEADLGLYFCGTKSVTSEMIFHKPISLQLEDKRTGRESVTDPADVEITDEVTVTERVLMFGGVGLVILVFFLTTVVAGGIIYHRGWQKGWNAAKQTSLIDHKSAQ